MAQRPGVHRMLVFIGIVTLFVGVSRANALPFMPDFTNVTFLDATFGSTGLNTICQNCGDSDPSNDFKAVLSFFPTAGGPNSGQLIVSFGSIDFSGTNAFPPLPFSDTIRLHVLISQIDNNPEYPLPSNKETILTGSFQLFHLSPDDPAVYITRGCCSGGILGATFQSGGLGFIEPHLFPEGSLPIDMHFFPVGTYTPTPEPASMLLVGTGLLLAAGRWHRPRRQH